MRHIRSTTRPVSHDGRDGTAKHTTQTAFAVEVFDHVEDAVILGTALTLSLDLRDCAFVTMR